MCERLAVKHAGRGFRTVKRSVFVKLVGSRSTSANREVLTFGLASSDALFDLLCEALEFWLATNSSNELVLCTFPIENRSGSEEVPLASSGEKVEISPSRVTTILRNGTRSSAVRLKLWSRRNVPIARLMLSNSRILGRLPARCQRSNRRDMKILYVSRYGLPSSSWPANVEACTPSVSSRLKATDLNPAAAKKSKISSAKFRLCGVRTASA